MLDKYQYTVEFIFDKDVIRDLADDLADALFEASYCRNAQAFQVKEVEGCWAVEINQGVFEGNDFERALTKDNFLTWIQDIQYECIGFGQHFFYKIEKGVLYDCGTIQKPDGEWLPFDRWMKDLNIQKGD